MIYLRDTVKLAVYSSCYGQGIGSQQWRQGHNRVASQADRIVLSLLAFVVLVAMSSA